MRIMAKDIRTRIAPSPTGFPHIGTAYQALLDKGFAKHSGGKFVLRVEDTDQKRFVGEAESKIYESLDWLELSEDEGVRKGGEFGPYKQSERLSTYQKYAKQLVEAGHAYYCFCTQERLQKLREEQQSKKLPPMYDKHCETLSVDEVKKRIEAGEPYVIRMKVPQDTKIVVNDLIRGDIEFDSNTVDHQVILKSDGFPTYHLAVVVDDHLMKISHVVRGPEWIPSFPKHKLLYDYFGWEMPVFVHTPLITNMQGKKLSKRDASTNIDWYKNEGFLPEALINFIALLGWSHPKQIEKFTFEEFAKNFDLKDLSAVNPKLDLTKLEWLNGQYIKDLSPEQFYTRVIQFDPKFKKHEEKKFKIILSQIQPRVKKLSEIEDLVSYFYQAPTNFDEIIQLSNKESGLDTKGTMDHMTQVKNVLKEVGEWNAEDIDKALHYLLEKSNLKPRQFFMPIRIVVTGRSFTPPLGDVLEILGKDESIKRIDSYLAI